MWKTILQNYLTPLVVLVLAGVVVFDHFGKDRTPVAPATSHEAMVVKLGADYKISLTKIGGAGIKAVAKGTFANVDELTKMQNGALDTALIAAYTPIANELERRFGKAEDESNKPSLLMIQSFFNDLDYGYDGGK